MARRSALHTKSALIFIQLAAVAFARDRSYAERKRPPEAIQDNSFLIEEAYNQEPGMAQHIVTGFGRVNELRSPDDREWALSFTLE